MRVLYVDDEPDIREVARMSLELDGDAVVETAASGAEAVLKAQSFKPDIILLDVMMPDLDGPATLGLLRAQPASAAVPVVFITAQTQSREAERFRTLGVIAVIPKPFDPMTLAKQVRDLGRSLGSVRASAG
ncbi:MAG TPA: response regulator [Hansschlegelia sp.]